MEQLNFITNLLEIKDKNIIILDYKDSGTHKEILAKLDYPAPKCPHCQGKMAKYDFQKESKIPYLECAGYKTLIRGGRRRRLVAQYRRDLHAGASGGCPPHLTLPGLHGPC